MTFKPFLKELLEMDEASKHIQTLSSSQIDILQINSFFLVLLCKNEYFNQLIRFINMVLQFCLLLFLLDINTRELIAK